MDNTIEELQTRVTSLACRLTQARTELSSRVEKREQLNKHLAKMGYGYEVSYTDFALLMVLANPWCSVDIGATNDLTQSLRIENVPIQNFVCNSEKCILRVCDENILMHYDFNTPDMVITYFGVQSLTEYRCFLFNLHTLYTSTGNDILIGLKFDATDIDLSVQ